MQCPVCDARLRSVEKHGVEVDVCPDCKGVWLDRGELEKILEMAEGGGPVQRSEPERREEQRPVYTQDEQRHGKDHDHDHEREPEHGHNYDPKTGKPKRKSSWLSDILGSIGGED